MECGSYSAALNVFAFEFGPKAAGFYQIDCEVSGKLANQEPFTQVWFSYLRTFVEDLRVISVEQQAVDLNGDGKADEARVQVTFEAEIDGEVQISATLWKVDVSEQIPSPVRIPPTFAQVKKGIYTVIAPVPKEALEQSGQNVLLLLDVAPRLDNGPYRGGNTYWEPGTSGTGVSRVGVFPLARKPVKAAGR